MNLRPKVVVIAGDGVNCERETALAFQMAGAQTNIVHINDLICARKLAQYQAMALPGGFSFGDDLGSGQVLGLKLKNYFKEDLLKFVENKSPIIGICNGFQVLTKLGLLPHPFEPRTVSLAPNEHGTFIDRWVKLSVTPNSPCIWTRGCPAQIEMPIRHGEGRVYISRENYEQVYGRLRKNVQIPLRYTENVNGSDDQIAGLCDPSGMIFGLMPHPEAFLSNLLHPTLGQTEAKWDKGQGLQLFENAINYIKEK